MLHFCIAMCVPNERYAIIPMMGILFCFCFVIENVTSVDFFFFFAKQIVVWHLFTQHAPIHSNLHSHSFIHTSLGKKTIEKKTTHNNARNYTSLNTDSHVHPTYIHWIKYSFGQHECVCVCVCVCVLSLIHI